MGRKRLKPGGRGKEKKKRGRREAVKLDQNWVFMQREILLFVPYEGGKPHNFEIQNDIFTVLDYLKDSLSTTEVLYWTNMEPVVALKEDHNGE